MSSASTRKPVSKSTHTLVSTTTPIYIANSACEAGMNSSSQEENTPAAKEYWVFSGSEHTFFCNDKPNSQLLVIG